MQGLPASQHPTETFWHGRVLGRECPKKAGETLGDGQGDPLGSGALTSCVVEVQGHLLVAHCHTSRVLLKHRRGIVL